MVILENFLYDLLFKKKLFFPAEKVKYTKSVLFCWYWTELTFFVTFFRFPSTKKGFPGHWSWKNVKNVKNRGFFQHLRGSGGWNMHLTISSIENDFVYVCIWQQKTKYGKKIQNGLAVRDQKLWKFANFSLNGP